jgi:DNA-directed RNA polymerase specialized sigma54-like protein
MKASLFICQLSKQNQEKIRNEIINFLKNEGYEDTEIEEISNNVMDSRLSDIEEFINIGPFIEEGKVIKI